MTAIEFLGIASMLFVFWFTWREAFHRDQGSGQTKRAAIVEAWVNIVIGFSLNFTMNLFLLPAMTAGGHLTLSNNFWGGWIFTVLSILRQYSIRRWFNSRIHLFAERAAAAVGRIRSS